MLVYVSHPIDLANEDVSISTNWGMTTLQDAVNNSKADLVLFRPQDAFYVPRSATVDSSIESVNQAVQSHADAMIVLWPKDARSWGVPVEVERAIQSGIPVAFVSNVKPTWAMPQAWHTEQNFMTFDYSRVGISQAVMWASVAKKQGMRVNHLPTKLLNDSAQVPTKAYFDDAGFDLYVSEETWIQPGEFVDVPCAVAVELPSDTWALLTGRSSTLRKHKLMVNQGVIDPGYRGELFAGVWNLGKEPVQVNVGDRLAQLILMSNRALNTEILPVDELTPHARGQSGFGSSGR